MAKHTSDEEKIRLYQSWQQSSLTKKEFCELNNIRVCNKITCTISNIANAVLKCTLWKAI